MSAASTPPPVYPPPAPARRPVDVLGIVAVGVAGPLLALSLVVFLVGLIPEMNAIWWLGIVLIPVLGLAGALAVVFGIIGMIVAVRRGSRFVWSIIGIVLGLLAIAPLASLWLSSLSS